MAAMLKFKQLTVGLFVMLVGGYVVSACGNDCKDLADRICNCQATRAQQQRCQQAANAANGNTSLSSQEQDVCKKILDSGKCTCDALDAGDFAACGLANSPPSP